MSMSHPLLSADGIRHTDKPPQDTTCPPRGVLSGVGGAGGGKGGEVVLGGSCPGFFVRGGFVLHSLQTCANGHTHIGWTQ